MQDRWSWLIRCMGESNSHKLAGGYRVTPVVCNCIVDWVWLCSEVGLFWRKFVCNFMKNNNAMEPNSAYYRNWFRVFIILKMTPRCKSKTPDVAIAPYHSVYLGQDHMMFTISNIWQLHARKIGSYNLVLDSGITLNLPGAAITPNHF